MKKRILIIGGGLSGITIGCLFKNKGYYVEIREKNSEIGGLLNDKWDKEAKCFVSFCGPHIAHFSKKRGTLKAFKFLSKFTKWIHFDHKVLALGPNSSFTYWPISKPYQILFDKLNAKEKSFDFFVKNYSKKMWLENTNEVLKNIKGRFKAKDSNSNLFFEGQKTFIPQKGFLNMLKKMTKGIKIVLNKSENILTLKDEYDNWDKIIVTSNIDDFFLKKFGLVSYRGMDFEFFKIKSNQSILPTCVVNLNNHPKYTRLSEMNQFYNYKSKIKIMCLETPSNNGRFYPVQTKKNLEIIKQYLEYSKEFPKIVMLGRSGTGKYLDIDLTVQQALDKFEDIKDE